MEFITKWLIDRELERQKQLRTVYNRRRERVKDMSEYRLKISHSRGRKYFSCWKKGESKRYLGKRDFPLVRKIQELHLCEKMLELIDENINLLDNLKATFHVLNAENVRRAMPSTYVPEDLEAQFQDRSFPIRWKKQMEKIKKAHSSYRPEELTVATRDGTKVRSRAEAMLYDLFTAMGLVVIYEFPIKIGNRILVPDFLILHPKTMRVYVWEHLGMWFHRDYSRRYRERFCEKTEEYAKIGFVMGLNLIASYEKPHGGIDMSIMQELCRCYFYADCVTEGVGVDAREFLLSQKKLWQKVA